MERATLMLLGAGELGKEIAISAKRLGLRVVAADRYDDAPAMQVSDAREVMSLQDGTALEGAIRTHRPDIIVPELEAVRAEKLEEMEEAGFRVVPNARAVRLTMDRETTRRFAAEEVGLPTAEYAFAGTGEELRDACDAVGYPCVVKPVVSYSGKGQSVVTGPAKVERAWEYARAGSQGDEVRVIAEEYVDFETEITQLVVRHADGEVLFVDPVAHRNDAGDLREAWMPADLPRERAAEARELARRVVDRLGGAGVFGVEFFVTPSRVVFSEVAPRPHDTGLVTMISQDLSQFDLHVRAVLGLPVPTVRYHGPAAAAVILAHEAGRVEGYDGLDRALEVESAQIRIFGKPEAYRNRRMGVALATGPDTDEARARALEAAARVDLRCG